MDINSRSALVSRETRLRSLFVVSVTVSRETANPDRLTVSVTDPLRKVFHARRPILRQAFLRRRGRLTSSLGVPFLDRSFCRTRLDAGCIAGDDPATRDSDRRGHSRPRTGGCRHRHAGNGHRRRTHRRLCRWIADRHVDSRPATRRRDARAAARRGNRGGGGTGCWSRVVVGWPWP